MAVASAVAFAEAVAAWIGGTDYMPGFVVAVEVAAAAVASAGRTGMGSTHTVEESWA